MPPRGGSSHADERTLLMRRAIAGAALLVILILIVVGIHSCTVGSGSSALRSYNDSVTSLIRASNATGQQFFGLLSGHSGSSNSATLQSEVEATRRDAVRQLQQAQGLSAPSQLTLAQQGLVWTMRMRRDGIAIIGSELQPALQRSTAGNAVKTIAAAMGSLYASDAVYKNYTLPMVESALRNAGISVGGTNGQPVDNGQFVPHFQWLSPDYIATQLHTTLPSSTSNKPAAPGVHGHALDSCNVGSTTLDTTVATTLPAGAAPTLTCAVTNDGQNTETNVHVQASVSGTSIIAQGTIPQTQPGQQYNVQIPLGTAPPNGTYQLKVSVLPVPGEKTFTHNTKIFPVTFG
jgi:hypothetical protein